MALKISVVSEKGENILKDFQVCQFFWRVLGWRWL